MRGHGRTISSALFSLLAAILTTLLVVGFGITDEVPVGGLQGVVVMDENGRPLPGAFVTMTRLTEIDPDEEEDISTEHHFRVKKDGKFQLRGILTGHYFMSVSAKAHKLAKFLVDIEEGKPTAVTLSAPPIGHHLEMYAGQRVFLPGETAKIELNGFAGVPAFNAGPPSVIAKVYQLNFDKVVKDGGIYNALAPLARTDNKVVDPAKMGARIKNVQLPLSLDGEGTFANKLELPGLTEGLYWIKCEDGDVSAGTWISVTKIAVIVKHTDKEFAAYVTHLDTGQPVTDAKVGFATPAGIESVPVDKNGLARMLLKPKKSDDDAEVVVASESNSRALVDFHRGSSGDDGDSDSDPSSAGDSEIRFYTYTDRPIYRPGDQVHFKGIVRNLVGSNYHLPTMHSVDIQIQDSSGTVLNKQTVPLNAMCSYNGSYTFSPDALPDTYQLVTNYGDSSSTVDVPVAAYRKPTFSIDVTSEKKQYIRGDTAAVTVQAKYYYGSPVVGAKVSATVTRDPYWDWRDYDDSEDDFQDDYGGEAPPPAYPGDQLTSPDSGDEVQTLTGTTDANGKLVLKVATMGTNEDQEAANDYTYTVSVEISDETNKQYDGSGSFTVLRSDETLHLDSDDRIVTAGEIFHVRARLADPSGKPIPAVNIQMTSGFLVWDHKTQRVVDRSLTTGTTGADGAASFSFTPQGIGYYEIDAKIQDDRGHTVAATTEVFLWNNPPPSVLNQSGVLQGAYSIPDTDLSVMLDKKRYKAGDTVKALITCNRPGGVAMIAIEGARIYTVQTFALKGKANVYQFKVLNDYSPNAFFSVSYVKDKHYANASSQILVDLGVKKLTVTVSSDKDTYHPGDTAIYTITTKDSSGRPASAEVSLGLVDESIYAIFDDDSDIVKGFYPKRDDTVSTDYSFPELYLGGGDKAPTNLQVRRNFKDTAYWNPDTMTDKTGTAILRLKLPDNLTSWRATVRAVTSDTKVGQATSNAIVRKDLMVQLSAPSFIVLGDKERLIAMVTNDTGRDASVHVTLTSTNAQVDGNLDTTVQVASGAVQTVEYKVSPRQSGESDFTAKAWIDNGASDGIELKVPVTPHARLETDGYAGMTTATKPLDLELKQGFDPNSGSLQISVAPTVATALMGSLQALVDYPYGCVEQTTSRFLPTVVFGKAYADMGLPKPKLFDKIPQIVQDSYARLKSMENSDGGWGWWEFDKPDPYMTAYVLEALKRADQAGYPTPSGINVKSALDWACAFIKDPKLPYSYRPSKQELNELKSNTAYLTYAVALHGRSAEAKGVLDHVDATQADALQCAFYALAANLLGAAQAANRDMFLKKMIALDDESRSTCEWAEQDWWGRETTGRCFMTLETLQPNSPLIPKIVAYLMQERKGAFWYSTRDTSAILLAMADYLRHTKELATDSDIVVSLNGRQVQELKYAKGKFPANAVNIKLPISALRLGSNTLQFESKTGACYFTSTLSQYVSQENFEPISYENSLTASRSYYLLETQKMEDGTLKLMPSKQSVTSFKPGDVIRCAVTIHTDVPRDFVYIEVPTPSGLHVTDRETPGEGDTWDYWWSRTVILDNRVVLFARDVPAGDNEIDYVLEAENPGSCSGLPVSVYNMYDPHVFASSADLKLEVSE